MKLARAISCVLIVCLLVSMALPMASAKRPDGGGKPDKPSADPVIAVVTPTGRGWNSLYVMNADGSNRVEVFEGYSLDTPSWSPDGTSIAFSEYYTELWRIDVVIDEDGVPIGQNKIQLLDGGMQGSPEWSPGGPYSGYILISRYPDAGYSHTLEVIPEDGLQPDDEPIELYTDPDATLWNAVWSPDGYRIAVIESEGGVSTLAILDYNQVTGRFDKTVSHDLPVWPICMDWARQRTQDEIAYSVSRQVGKKNVHELYTIDSGSGDINFLFNGWKPTWSPDDKLCYEYRGLNVHDFDTGMSEQISKWGWYPDWSRA